MFGQFIPISTKFPDSCACANRNFLHKNLISYWFFTRDSNPKFKKIYFLSTILLLVNFDPI